MAIVRALALYEFHPSADVELSLKPGDVVIVKNKNAGEGWCEGELNGKRGLFPKAFVKMITFGGGDDDEDEGEESADNSPAHTNPAPNPLMNIGASNPPLTPQSSKKVFMETLLTPTPDTIKKVYDEAKAKEIYVEGHKIVAIESGPHWKNRPPTLTIVVHDERKGVRSSGQKLQKSYDVSTKELKVSVIRKYKHFLWLYDQLAEKFPCISLPPLPIKQAMASVGVGENSIDSKRRGLERFLNRVARHPVLGCAKIFHLFLTATNEKEWRIGTGKHSSLIRTGGAKSTKKLMSAPIYNTVQYPPYNVPLNQLASFDKFSKFTNVMEVNLSNMQRACETLMGMHRQMSTCLRSLGKDVQNLAEGADQPSLGARYRKASQGLVSLPNSHLAPSLLPLTTSSEPNLDSDEDEDSPRNEIGGWNWREDETFVHLMAQLHDLGSCMRQTSLRARRYQEQMSKGVIESLEEYSGIIHTLPVLVKLHEEAMAVYNESKQKGSKSEAEDIRQDCETLNNILLAEFDYFSEQMIVDLQEVILTLMKAEADYHKKLASDWENMYASFSENKPIRRTTIKRSTTLPGSQAIDDGHTSPNQQHRPASTEQNLKKLDVSPPTSRKPYVNLPIQKDTSNGNDNEHLYENVPLKSPGKEDTGIYENWNPTLQNSKATPNHVPLSFSSSSPLPPTTRPIPPPLIIKRHELMADQKEAQRIGQQTDSFVVPNLAHYSQVSVGGLLERSGDHENSIPEEGEEEWTKQREKMEEIGRILQKEVAAVKERLSTTDTESSKQEDTPRSGSLSSEVNRKDTLTESNVEAEGTKVKELTSEKEKDKDTKQNISSSKKKDMALAEKMNSSNPTYSPQINTKLAQLTQLPQQRSKFSPPPARRTGPSKSFSTQQDPVSRTLLPARTLPKGYKKPSTHTANDGKTELLQKLEHQRKRLDRQMSGESVQRTGLTKSLPVNKTVLKDEDKDSLSKFGIEEDKDGGSFIV